MLVQSKDASRIVGLESWQIQSYAKQGFVESAVSGNGAGSRKAYDLGGLIRLALIRQLLDDGVDLRAVRDVFTELFDIPSPGETDIRQHAGSLRAWFDGKVMITTHRFTHRKIVKRGRLEAILAELLCENCGVYIIDIGVIVNTLLDNYLAYIDTRTGQTE